MVASADHIYHTSEIQQSLDLSKITFKDVGSRPCVKLFISSFRDHANRSVKLKSGGNDGSRVAICAPQKRRQAERISEGELAQHPGYHDPGPCLAPGAKKVREISQPCRAGAFRVIRVHRLVRSGASGPEEPGGDAISTPSAPAQQIHRYNPGHRPSIKR